MRPPALFLVALLGLGGCSPRTEPPASQPQPQPQSQPQSARGPLRALEARFPGPIKRKVKPVSTPVGTLEQHTEMFENQHMSLVVQWAEFPQDYVARVTPQQLYEEAASGAAAAVRGRIQGMRRLELDGVVGHQAIIDDGRGALYEARSFLLGARLYQAAVATSPERLSDAMVQEFFASLRVVQRTR